MATSDQDCECDFVLDIQQSETDITGQLILSKSNDELLQLLMTLFDRIVFHECVFKFCRRFDYF